MQISAIRQSEKPFDILKHAEFQAEYMRRYDIIHNEYKTHRDINKLQSELDIMEAELDVTYPKMGKVTLPADGEAWVSLYHELKAGLQIVCHKDTNELILVIMDADY